MNGVNAPAAPGTAVPGLDLGQYLEIRAAMAASFNVDVRALDELYADAQCGVLLAGVGGAVVTLSDLLARPLVDSAARVVDCAAVLRAAAFEARIIVLYARGLIDGEPLAELDRELVRRAYRNLDRMAARWAI